MTFKSIAFFNFFVAVLASVVNCSLDLYCRDEKNQKVDWFVNYKIPKLEKGYIGNLAEGKAYSYITPSKPGYWTLSKNDITAETSMLSLTLQHFFDVQVNSSYLFYNDEPPLNFNGTAKGHLKGIVAFDGTSGFWLVHSIPKFCDPKEYRYPDNALSNGQSILCISFPTTALNAISKQLLFSHPKIYKYGITKEVLVFLDDVAKTIFTDKPAFVRKSPFESTETLKSLNQETFISFAKDNQLEEDLYSDIVAPGLRSSLATETWRRGSGTFLPPSCSSNYSVLDVISINMSISNQNLIFKSTEDHSKWAVSTKSSEPWICIGDINRMDSQKRRGGGTVCFQSKTVWKAYYSIIAEIDQCPLPIKNDL